MKRATATFLVLSPLSGLAFSKEKPIELKLEPLGASKVHRGQIIEAVKQRTEGRIGIIQHGVAMPYAYWQTSERF